MGLLWFTVCAAFALAASTDPKLIYGCSASTYHPAMLSAAQFSPSGIFGKKQAPPSPKNNLSTQFQFGQFEQLVRFPPAQDKTCSSSSASRAATPNCLSVSLSACLPVCQSPSVCLSRFLHCLGTLLVHGSSKFCAFNAAF